MKIVRRESSLLALGLILLLVGASAMSAQAKRPDWIADSIAKLEGELVEKYGESQRERLQRGLSQVADFWRAEDGDAEAFENFAQRHFAGDRETLDEMFNRFERLLEQLDGHMLEISLEFKTHVDLDIGPIYPFDEVFAGYSPEAHVLDDFFENKLAFVVLLNFPLTTLEQRLTEGENWTRRQWAEARLAQRFSKRIPAEVNIAISKVQAEADQYIAEYNIWMHHLLGQDGRRLFPPKLKLLSHWNLRDEIKANYGDPESGLAKQRLIQRVMERIVTQTIPEIVVNNPHVDWNPYTNEVSLAAVSDSDSPVPPDMRVSDAREPDTRYEVLLKTFHAAKKVDPYSPTAPTLIARRFDETREIPEERVKEMFDELLSSPVLSKVAELIESRLGRPLEPFDIWYNGFRPGGGYTEAELNEIVSKNYPTAKAYEKDMPSLLMKLGFDKDRAQYLADNIVVDPARGSGHAAGAAMRSAKARLRTRVGSGGMDYKGFNIAVHEMGHNVEQTLSLKDIDHTLLEGVPNGGFTEAIAFVFQERDLELLDLDVPRDAKNEAMKTLSKYWNTCQIAAVSLVDMEVWHWMYDHPDATPQELKDATIRIAKDIWNRYYAEAFKVKDVLLLGIYSHMIHYFLYLPDYPLGHLISFQIEEQMKKAGKVGPEVERIATLGRIAPDLWMKIATGSRVSAEPFLKGTEQALKELEEG